MKRFGLGVLALALLALFMSSIDMPSASAQSTKTYAAPKTMWAAKRANVRVGPSTNHAKVGLLEVGERVSVVARTGNWYQLRGYARRFVYAPLLNESKPHVSRSADSQAAVRTMAHEGGQYRGLTRNGRPHGRGVLTWANGDRFEGEFRNGRRTGHGVYRWAEGELYEGDFVNGKRHGRGVYTWPNGDRYEGRFVDGKRTGSNLDVKAMWHEGGTYRGSTRNGHPHGRGVLTWANGDRYEGEWRKGKRFGQGAYTFADGDRYMQEWKGGAGRDVNRPRSTCLDVERVNKTFAFWINRCSVGIDVNWRDEGSCRSRSENRYPCSWFVGANGKATAMIEGHVWWVECKSPGGLGDVLAIEKKDGKVYCMTSGNPQTLTQKKKQRSTTSRLAKKAIADRNAEQARQEREWQREMERLEEEQRRRQAETWKQVGESLGSTLRMLMDRDSGGSYSPSGDDCINTDYFTCSVQ